MEVELAQADGDGTRFFLPRQVRAFFGLAWGNVGWAVLAKTGGQGSPVA